MRCHNLQLTCEYTVSMVGRMSTKRNHRRSKSKSVNVSSAQSQASSVSSETTSNPLPATPNHPQPLLGPDLNICSSSDDFTTDYYSEVFDATMLPATIEHEDPSKAVSLADDSLAMFTLGSDSNFPSLTAQDQNPLDDPYPMFPDAGGMPSQAASGASLGAISLAPPKNTPLSVQSLEPSLQYIQNNSESLFRYPYLLPIINIIVTTEAHLQRASIPIDEAMRTNKACMSQIARTMEDAEFIKCNSCSLLIATAMQMVIMLYEKALFASDQASSCSAKDDGDPSNGMTRTGSPHSAMLSTLATTSTSSTSTNDQQHAVSSFSARPSCTGTPSLQFGVFQLEPEEQIWFRNQIIRKELQRCIQTLRACHTEKLPSKLQAATGASPPALLGCDRVRKTWLMEMERRANALIASLPVGQAYDVDADVDQDRACG